jgi:metal-responsive CopG/Arc/MetJ family transcriptional regulator
MKVKTSVTLPSALLEEIDRVDSNRSAFLERAALAYLARSSKEARDLRDAKILDRHADRLNAEAADVLEYQGFPE